MYVTQGRLFRTCIAVFFFILYMCCVLKFLGGGKCSSLIVWGKLYEKSAVVLQFQYIRITKWGQNNSKELSHIAHR